MGSSRSGVRKQYEAVSLPIWLELMAGVEMLYLKVSPVYWGFGVPEGDRSGVVVVPGFMLNDLYLAEFRSWLNRIGYRSYSSGIGINAECPNILVKQHLVETVEQAYAETKKKVHVIGHSLGGLITRYYVQRMERMWYSRKYDNAPMPHALFFEGRLAIHGTNAIRQLGRPASHGCVRLSPGNARTLFDLVRQHGGAQVVITD